MGDFTHPDVLFQGDVGSLAVHAWRRLQVFLLFY